MRGVTAGCALISFVRDGPEPQTQLFPRQIEAREIDATLPSPRPVTGVEELKSSQAFAAKKKEKVMYLSQRRSLDAVSKKRRPDLASDCYPRRDVIFFHAINHDEAGSARRQFSRRREPGLPMFGLFTVHGLTSLSKALLSFLRARTLEHDEASVEVQFSFEKKKEKKNWARQNKPKRGNLFSDRSFPYKYYQVTYTCPTYQILRIPSTTMRHINVSKR